MEENVSYELRQKRSRKMKAMAQRLKQARKIAASKHADSDHIKKRAAKLAKALLRKKMAGLQGAHYASLSTAAKMSIDKLVDGVPKSKLKGLAKRLVPVVSKAEQARLASRREHQKSQVAEQFDEAHVSHKQRMYRKAAAERSAHKRKAGSGHDSNKHREGSGLGRSLNRIARSEILKQFGGKLKGREFTDAAAKAMLVDRGDRLKAIRNRSKRRKDEKRGSRADHTRRSTRKNTYGHDRAGGHGSLRSDYEADFEFDMMLAEGDDKFEQLFIRGLVPKGKVQHYKRIFKDVKETIKLRRYQEDIADILEDLIKIVTEDDVIYRRVRLGLQKKSWK